MKHVIKSSFFQVTDYVQYDCNQPAGLPIRTGNEMYVNLSNYTVREVDQGADSIYYYTVLWPLDLYIFEFHHFESFYQTILGLICQ